MLIVDFLSCAYNIDVILVGTEKLVFSNNPAESLNKLIVVGTFEKPILSSPGFILFQEKAFLLLDHRLHLKKNPSISDHRIQLIHIPCNPRHCKK